MKALKGLALALALCLAAGFMYFSDGYTAGEAAQRALEGDKDVKVSRVSRVWRFDGPGTEAALVFYPGGKVEARAYAPLMAELASRGLDGFIPEMPLNVALLNLGAAGKLMREHDYARWYLGGHSLGGVAAAMWAANHPEGLEGLILLAAYPTRELPEGLRLLSIRGSLDGVLNMEKYEESRKHWPGDAVEVVIEGGNHAGLGDYGAQKGDKNSALSPERQREQAAQAILSFCNVR